MPIVKETVIDGEGKPVEIYIEVDTLPQAANPYTGLRGEGGAVIEAAGDVFGRGMKLIRTCAEQVVVSMQQLSHTARPDEFEVQLAIKLDSQVGAVLAKASAEAQLQVTMRWTKEDKV